MITRLLTEGGNTLKSCSAILALLVVAVSVFGSFYLEAGPVLHFTMHETPAEPQMWYAVGVGITLMHDFSYRSRIALTGEITLNHLDDKAGLALLEWRGDFLSWDRLLLQGGIALGFLSDTLRGGSGLLHLPGTGPVVPHIHPVLGPKLVISGALFDSWEINATITALWGGFRFMSVSSDRLYYPVDMPIFDFLSFGISVVYNFSYDPPVDEEGVEVKVIFPITIDVEETKEDM